MSYEEKDSCMSYEEDCRYKHYGSNLAMTKQIKEKNKGGIFLESEDFFSFPQVLTS